MSFKLSRSSIFSSNSQTSITAKETKSKPKVEYLYTVKAVKNYLPVNELEIELHEGEIYYVSEEKDYHFFVHSLPRKEKGYCPKNFLQRQNQFVSLLGFTIEDYKSKTPEELTTFIGDNLIIVAIENEHVHCKKSNASGIGAKISGKVPIKCLFIEGDISSLPLLTDYRIRTMEKKQAKVKQRLQIDVSPIKSLSRTPEEEKVAAKLRSQSQYNKSPLGFESDRESRLKSAFIE